VEKTSEEPKKTFWVVDGHQLVTPLWAFGRVLPKSTIIKVYRNPDASDFTDNVFFSVVEYNEENILVLKQNGFKEVEPPQR
jgi:hypothetical protein